ncbi:MAG: hypothetical protein H6541_13525 [Lentimicrobiaceae bacterium]|nr:hypothetical protein [Lentimicrobiaceae bacterium]MCO5266331.1 hypothetical protein [Lentimicrobium sp.]
MYLDKIMWLLAWPGMIALSYYLVVFGLKKLEKQIKSDPLGEDTNP